MSTRRGRPPAFDRVAALDRATRLFWQHGYEATSVKLLTTEIGITPSSLYAAFGDKETLFAAAIEHYRSCYQGFVRDSLEAARSPHEAVSFLLHRAVEEFTSTDHPHGCLIASAAVAVGAGGEPAGERLFAVRDESTRVIEAALTRLGSGRKDATVVAAYAATLFQGLSSQARDGVGAQTLHSIVDLALRAIDETRTSTTP